jgi:hypothetical protein
MRPVQVGRDDEEAEDQAWLDSFSYRDTLPLVSSIIAFGSKARIP